MKATPKRRTKAGFVWYQCRHYTGAPFVERWEAVLGARAVIAVQILEAQPVRKWGVELFRNPGLYGKRYVTMEEAMHVAEQRALHEMRYAATAIARTKLDHCLFEAYVQEPAERLADLQLVPGVVKTFTTLLRDLMSRNGC